MPVDRTLAWRQAISIGEMDMIEVFGHFEHIVGTHLVAVEGVIGVEHHLEIGKADFGAKLEGLARRVDEV